MPNILINPNSGIIEFSTGVAGGAIFDQNITSGNRAVRLGYDNFGGINITSYVNITGSGFASGQDRFSVDGANGRLFSVTDNLAGSLFSVNDIAGLPIIEAFDDNTVIMGAYNKNDFVLTGNSLGLGGLPNTGIQKLYVSGNTILNSSIPSGANPIPILTISGAWQDSTKIFTGIALNITDSGSSSNSLLIDLKSNNINRFSVSKIGSMTINAEHGGGAATNIYGHQFSPNANSLIQSYGIFWPSAYRLDGGYGLYLNDGAAIGWAAGNLQSSVANLELRRDNNGILAQRSGLNPQQFRVYNLTGTNSGEFGLIGWQNNNFIVGPQQTQSGVLRDITLTGANININASGTTTFNSRPTVNNTGIMLSGDLNSATLSTSCGLTGNILAGASDVIIPFTVKDDPRGWWNSSTNTWSPNIPGRYYVSYQINWGTGSLGNQINSQIRKSTNTVSLAQHQVPTVLNFTQNNTAIVTMNGTTGDYLDFTCYTSSPTTQYVIGSADGAWTHFEAFRLSN